MQIIGKVKLSKSPWLNHSWHSTFFLTPRGLTSALIHDGPRAFAVDFDFVDHLLVIQDDRGAEVKLQLMPESVASFYRKVFRAFDGMGIQAHIDPRPNELPDRERFSEDVIHCSYDPEFSSRFWQAMLRTHQVMQEFRSRYVGKVSPIHFFWGSMDLAITRFSGRRAPQHPGGVLNLPDLVTREAYSHEVSSCGFWPGNDLVPYPAFYSYAYPIPAGFESARIRPNGAIYHETLREFLLPYDLVRASADPAATLLDFFQSTYDAAANLGGWDRVSLEESPFLKLLQLSRASSRRAGQLKKAG